MENNENKSLTVLNSFTRKLANCRHTVSLRNLLKYMDEGKFGYTCEGDDEVVTNEYVFADDIATLVSRLRTIFKDPRMFLKKEYVIQNAAVATNMDSETTRETYRDDKLWKIKNGKIEPEYVHSFVNEDNFAVYENRFICALIDRVFEIVTKKINEVYHTLDTLGGQINGKAGGLSSENFLSFADEKDGVPCLLPSKSPLVAVVESLVKSKKQLLVFKTRKLYEHCKKAGKFELESVRQTNVLVYDANYNFCYNFYLQYLYKEPLLSNAQQRYFNYVTINFLQAMRDLGYELQDENPLVAVTNSVIVRFDPINYKKAPFDAVVELGENEILLTLTPQESGISARYAFKVYSEERAAETGMDGFGTPNGLARHVGEVRGEGNVHEFVISNAKETDEDNAAFIDPALADTQDKLKRLIKACTMIAEGAKAVHSRFCPICGSSLITFDGDNYECQNCRTFYTVFPFEEKELIWIKRLARQEKVEEPVEEIPEIQKEKALRLKLRARRRK